MRAADTDGDPNFFPEIDIYDPSGALVTANTNSNFASIGFVASKTGTYTAVVQHSSGSFFVAGNYNLYFARIPGANEGGPLINGGVISEKIDLGDIDTYTFTGNAGENVQIHAVSTSTTNFFPWIYLYDPSGALVNNAGGSQSRVATLSKTGTYTVMIIPSPASFQVGTFDLYFVHMPGANEGGLLVSGGVINGKIDLGDLDSFTFKANVGENVIIRVTDTNGDPNFFPEIDIYDPTGALVTTNHQNNDFALINFIASKTGTYTAVVQHSSGSFFVAGNYSLTFQINRALSYAALGDSFSSGEGVRPYFNPADTLFDGCHRSTRAYPTLLRVPGTTRAISSRADAHFDFFACTGAVTKNIPALGEGQYDDPPQLSPQNGVNDSRDLVTMSIGGNDAYFIRIVGWCYIHDSCNTLKPFAPYMDVELGDLFPLWAKVVESRLVNVYSELRAATPNATTLILDYPILVSGQECSALKIPFLNNFKLSKTEQAFMQGAIQKLNASVKQAAALIGLHYVPVADHFTGHEICGTLDDWINGLVPYNPKASFHPTSRGQFEYAKVANAYLESKRSGWPFGYHPTGLPKNPAPALAPLALNAKAAAAATSPLPEFGELQVSFASAPAGCASARDVIVPGGSAEVTGKGFAPSESVALSLAISGEPTVALGTVAADASGSLNATVVIPNTVPVGAMGSVEALAAGPSGVGRLLLSLVRVEDSITLDGDGDGIPNGCDNCPTNPNPDQKDSDGDGRGDVCDTCPTEFPNDEDGDGLCGVADACPLDPKNDADGDGLCANEDNCAITPNSDQVDANGDGIGDACATLACYPVNLTVSPPGNGEVKVEPANCGLDKYFQGTPLLLQAFPAAGNFFNGWTGTVNSAVNPLSLTLSASATLKANFCGGTVDSDGDLVADACDNCSAIPNANQADTDGDNIGNACDPDFNQNGIVDQFDFSRLKACFGKSAAICPNEDLNGNGVVDQFDFSRLKAMFGKRPGPSGLVK